MEEKIVILSYFFVALFAKLTTVGGEFFSLYSKKMRKIVILSFLVVFVCVWSVTIAYEPTQEDNALTKLARQYMEELYPENSDHLLDLYAKLDRYMVEAEVGKQAQALYLLQDIKKNLRELLFATFDEEGVVCLDNYTQQGDTVEVHYSIHQQNNALLRATEGPLVFNPGKQQVWKSLDRSVLWLQEQEMVLEKVASYRLSSDDGVLQTTVDRDAFVARSSWKSPAIGMTYVFGSTEYHWVVLAEIVGLDEERVWLDFSRSGPLHPVYLRVTVEKLMKYCQK